MADKKPIDEFSGIETTGHEWDGIRELDNPLPNWWRWIFYGCIVWSIGYYVAYPAIPLIGGYTYQWYENSILMSGETNNTLNLNVAVHYSVAGTYSYYVEVTHNGCTVKSNLVIHHSRYWLILIICHCSTDVDLIL